MRCLVRVLVVSVLVSMALPAAAQEFFPQSVASGDPRADSVVLWTRVVSPTDEDPKVLTVEVATDPGFADLMASRDITAEAEDDYAVKVLVDGLQPYTTYWYRFRYGAETSPVGRTRTAPAPGDPRPLKFAVVYCQDFVGRWYNSYAKLLAEHDDDLDFVVHLGDYVYETTGSPDFQDPTGERVMEFGDVDGAIPLGGDNLAAASLANYRTLYRTYRSDDVFREVHERWPMIVIWDDHEYSDDSWGATATYFDGLVDETNVDRKHAAERAFFEWTPSEMALDDGGELSVEDGDLYPNTMIYRDFLFGSMLHLVMTDYRTYRPDHLIPEDAYPGQVVLEEDDIVQLLGQDGFAAISGSLDPYVNLDLVGGALPILRQTATLVSAVDHMNANPALDLATAIQVAKTKLRGNLSVTYINALFEAAGLAAPFGPEVMQTLPRGLSYLLLGKTSLYSSTGSRYLVIHDSYRLLAGALAAATGGAAQNPFGADQLAWLQGTLGQSPATWKVLGSSVSMAPMVLDLTNPQIAPLLPPETPDELRTRLTLNVDQWDGFPDMRAGILDLLAFVGNGLVISGDIHATFVTQHPGGIVEVTPPAISSGTFGELVLRTVQNDPLLGQIPGLELLIQQLALLMQISATDDDLVSPSDIIYTDTYTHGFGVFDVGEDAVGVTIWEIPSTEVFTSYYDDPAALDDLFTASTFTVSDGVVFPGR